MLQSETLFVCGVILAVFGKILSVLGRLGMDYAKEQYDAVANAIVPTPRLILNTRLDKLEAEHAALKMVHGQCAVANSISLDRIQKLERLLSDNGIEIPE